MHDNAPKLNGLGNQEVLRNMSEIRHDTTFSIPRSEKGHIAIITCKIDIRPMNADNTFDPYVLGDADLQKYGMTNKARIVIKAPSEAECAMKVKKLMENLNG